MKHYLCSSLRQLYLLFFWPTQFAREVEGNDSDLPKLSQKERVRYLLDMFPWKIVFFIVGNLLILLVAVACGRTFDWQPYGSAFNWEFGWYVFTFTVAMRLVYGFGFSVVLAMTRGAAFGLVYSLMSGLLNGLLCGLLAVVDLDLIWPSSFGRGIAFGVVFGVAFSRIGNSVVSAVNLKTFLVACAAAILVSFLITCAVATYWHGIKLGISFALSVSYASSVVFGISAGLVCPLVWGLLYFGVLTYPFDILLTTTTYIVARLRPGSARQMWRLCPISWNEVIRLPLPFANSLLTLLVRQDKDEGLRQIAFIASERKLQRRVAYAALVELVLNDLNVTSLAELSDVTKRLNWTTEVTAQLPLELSATLPYFERASQHVEQYVALNSQYRKSEALKRAQNELRSSQAILLGLRGDSALRVLEVTNVWRRLLYWEKAKTVKAVSTEVPNPFVVGNPVMETEQNLFTGRRCIVQQIEASVLGAMQGPALLLHGPRRMGKTSILNQLPRLLGPDFATAVVDCQSPAVTESAPTMLRYLSRKLSEGLHRKRITIKPLAANTLSREPFAVFDEWLDGVELVMPEGMRALLCLDEYERLQGPLEAGWGGAFLDTLRHTLQHRPRVVLMFTGAHTFQELGPAWTDRFISTRRVRVSFLTREEVLPLLTQPIPTFDMTYAPGSLDAFFWATNGQPFLTQATAFELVQLLNEQQRKEATPEDVESAIVRALDSSAEYFANLWSDAGPEGQSILRSIVRRETPPDLLDAWRRLREHDVLNLEGDFAVEMVRRWVKTKCNN